MRAINGNHLCPACKKEDATYKRQKTNTIPSDGAALGWVYATRPVKIIPAAFSDKNAWVHECTACNAIVAQCPYCRTINEVDDVTADCTKCTNMFIVHR